MRRIQRIYLAGSGERLAEADELSREARLLCEAEGYEALIPGAMVLTESEPSEAMAREIYAERLALLRKADAAVVDLSPFRGPHCDPAAAFEAGFLAGLGKPVFAYMNVMSEEEADLGARVEAYVGVEAGEDGALRDSLGALVEDFGLPESLMLWAEARRLYVVVTGEPWSDLTGLRLCLGAVKLYAD